METNILFTSAGRRVSLIRHFRSALAELQFEGKIVTADISPIAPAHRISDKRVIVPRCNSEDFIPALLEMCKLENIRLLVPTIDTELQYLAAAKGAFEDIGTRVLVSDLETIKIGGDKRHTASFFVSNDIPTPEIYSHGQITTLTERDLPILVKPADGSSSIDVHKINKLGDLQFYLDRVSNPIVQQFIDGEEYTIDVYADFSGVPRCAIPRKRLEVRAGEVSKALTVRDTQIIERSLDLVAKLPGAIGCETLQCIKTHSQEIYFIEINPRFGGGFPLSFHAGGNFPKWILQELNGLTPDFDAAGNWRDQLYMLRYDDELIVHSDDL